VEKIDCFTHIMPRGYYDQLRVHLPPGDDLGRMIDAMPDIADPRLRLKIMDRHGVDAQVITISSPPAEVLVHDGEQAAALARRANDEIAEFAAGTGGRFIPVGTVAMNHPQHMVDEARRCIGQLGMKGVLIYSSAAGRALDLPEFAPFFAAMAELDHPIWLHPARGARQPDYRGEETSKYWIWQVFGWPYETTAAMTRLVFSGVFDRHPDLKIITHHAGAMAPFFEGRIEAIYTAPQLPELKDAAARLKRPPAEYFRMFYGDTALMGGVGGMTAAVSYFGTDHLLFGTDTPFDGRGGDLFTTRTLASIEALAISPAQRAALFAGNARRLLHLD
jgi:uncharacterized protein